jgi:hypothetical protein
VSNGSSLYLKVKAGQLNQNSAYDRRLRDLIAAHATDLGGVEACSEAERVLIRRAAMLTLQLELRESHWTKDGGVASATELLLYQRCVGALRRCLRELNRGLKRRPRDVSPIATLDAIMQERPDG